MFYQSLRHDVSALMCDLWPVHSSPGALCLFCALSHFMHIYLNLNLHSVPLTVGTRLNAVCSLSLAGLSLAPVFLAVTQNGYKNDSRTRKKLTERNGHG